MLSMVFLLKLVDHAAQLVGLRRRQALAAYEGVEKAGQAAAEVALDEGAALGALHVLPAHQGGDGGVLRFDHAPVGKALDDGVGGGFLPA